MHPDICVTLWRFCGSLSATALRSWCCRGLKPLAALRRGLKPLGHPVDALSQGADVVRLDSGEHPNAELIAPQLAVGLGVDDAVGSQRCRDYGCVDLIGEVDGADNL